MKTYRDRAIVLRSFPLAEADRILVALTRDHGIVRAVAKGVRRTSSKFGARLQPFTVVELQLLSGRNLDTILQAETIASYGREISADYERYNTAHLMVEVTQRLCEDEEKSPAHFQLLYGALAALARGGSWRLIGASYLLRALAASGWAPALAACAICGRSAELSAFSDIQGGAVCAECGDYSAAPIELHTLELLRYLAGGDWDGAQRAVTQNGGAQAAFATATGFAQYHVEQRLKSLQVLERNLL